MEFRSLTTRTLTRSGSASDGQTFELADTPEFIDSHGIVRGPERRVEPVRQIESLSFDTVTVIAADRDAGRNLQQSVAPGLRQAQGIRRRGSP
jgi:hypothetical protein